jgi:asparagine synthase (glutamine-hydrolysing)
VLYGSDGLDATTKQQLLAELERANRASAGLLMPQPGMTIDSVRQVMGYVPSQLETWAGIGKGLLTVTSDEFRCAFADRDTYRLLMNTLDVERQMTGRDVINQSLYVWAKTMLPNYILSNLGDRMEMAHSVEGRVPFLDHHLVEAVAKMPVSMKINGMTEKWVLREAARPAITDTVYRRQKHPFMSPPAAAQQDGKLFAMLQDTLRSSLLDGPAIYDRAKVVRMLDAVPTMDFAARSRIDPVLMWMGSICLLHERLLMGTSPLSL